MMLLQSGESSEPRISRSFSQIVMWWPRASAYCSSPRGEPATST